MTAAELTQSHAQGTYAALQLSPHSQQQLAQWLDQRGIAHDDPAEFHCTVMYSASPVPQAESVRGPLTASASITGWELLGEQATVLLISCATAQRMHKLFRRHGASHSWPSYDAHVTVNSEQHLRPLPVELPPFALHFDRLTVKPIE
jgi:hypothetical protein